MFELTYRSRAEENITKEDILNILKSANDFNLKNNITGCLVFYDNHFIQILEGERNVVKSIFSKIAIDKRHSNVMVLSEGAKNERFFSDWNMAYADMDKANEASNKEVRDYANNLILLSEFMDKPTTSLKMFWAGIERLIIKPVQH